MILGFLFHLSNYKNSWYLLGADSCCPTEKTCRAKLLSTFFYDNTLSFIVQNLLNMLKLFSLYPCYLHHLMKPYWYKSSIWSQFFFTNHIQWLLLPNGLIANFYIKMSEQKISSTPLLNIPPRRLLRKLFQ